MNAPDWDAIARYLAGESSGEDAERLRRWLEDHPVDCELVERLKDAAHVEPVEVDVEAALRRVHARMHEPAPSVSVPRLTLHRVEAHDVRLRVAGLVTVLAAAAAVFALIRPRQQAVGSSPVARSYVTAIGRRDSVLLADGSRVVLGPDSRLTVPGDYGTTVRSVTLHGDGYFEVRHDAAKPFSVRVDRALVEDIGTTFTVESDDSGSTTVAVMSGSVLLRPVDMPAKAGAVLAAGDRGSLTPDGTVHSHPRSVADDAAWTTGRLVLRDASLARVAGELHRWYGVELRVADSSLLSRHVTASFNGESVDRVLEIIGLALGARIERYGDSATIHAIHGSAVAR